MESGKGDWGDNPADLNGLRNQYLAHMANYDRIFILRALQKAPCWRCELVEIPSGIPQLAKDGELEMKLDSRQFPKPGYCHVRNEQGEAVFSLYFDGGGDKEITDQESDQGLLPGSCAVAFFHSRGMSEVCTVPVLFSAICGYSSFRSMPTHSRSSSCVIIPTVPAP